MVLFFLGFAGCVTEYMPKTEENQDLLVVEGLITDQPGQNKIIISRSLPLGIRSEARPVTGASVSVSDNQGSVTYFRELGKGNYEPSDPNFRGVIGRIYKLHIRSYSVSQLFRNYESFPMELKPVPPIDSLYYEKITISGPDIYNNTIDGCQIYVSTHDPTNKCRYLRWKAVETWEIRLPYTVQNHTCWVIDNTENINVKSTASLSDAVVKKHPLFFISNHSDRLRVKYSGLVSQYSISEDEYNFWEKLQNLVEETGGLYDIIPSNIPGNIFCVDDPSEKILGYFSVSAVSTKRIFVKDQFKGQFTPYTNDACVADTLFNGEFIPDLNVNVWILRDNQTPPYKVITYSKECADCTTRGTTREPDFWKDDKPVILQKNP
jgi:hypothetical protein